MPENACSPMNLPKKTEAGTISWNTPQTKTIIKGTLFLLWVLLFALLLHRDYFIMTLDTREAIALERAERVEFQGIYFKEKKIGYVENQFIPADGNKLLIKQRAFMRLNISNQSHQIELNLQALLSSDDKLEQFEFEFSSPFYQMTADGTVKGNLVVFSLDTGNSTIEDQVSLNGPPMLSTSRRVYLLRQGISQGDKIRIPWFDPVSLTGKESVIEYRGKEQVLIHGRIFNLHRFTEFFSGIRVNSWLDDEGNVIKEESPAGFVFIKEPEFRAKALDDDSSELLSAVSVKIKGSMPEPKGRQSQRYRLTLPRETSFDLDGGRQDFTDDILTITLEQLPEDSDTDSITCPDATSELESSPYTQSDAPEIIEYSRKITAGLLSQQDKVKALADWVFNTLEKRPVLGIPDALTTLKNRIGDCNEHASLFTALARAAGIPTKIAAGVIYHKGAFYYHAWNEVCLSGRWISVDTTTNQFPADVSHIKFLEGELQEQVRIGALLGTLEIEPLTN